ncbi:polyketide synthase PksN, partial [Thermoflavimicrobium dichotomicum]
FRSIFFPVPEACELGNQIIVAQSDGVVRQKQPLPSRFEPEKQSVSESVSLPAQPVSQQKTNKRQRGDVGVTDQMIEDYVRTVIRENIAAALKMEETFIQDDRSFSEYGLDSILSVNVIKLINKQCNITLQTTVLFDYNNVNQLVRHITQAYKPALISLLKKNLPPVEDQKDAWEEVNHTGYATEQNLTHDGGIQRRQKDQGKDAIQVERSAERVYEKETVQIKTFMQQDSIAIIGMSGRFGKANSIHELWKYLANGTELVEEVTRWDLSGKNISCKYGSLLEHIDQFDPLFFNISGLEATYMDPQQRIFLEEAWKALEDAGYAGSGMDGRLCGVYVGWGGSDYESLFGDQVPPQAFWGNAGSVIPARIAYYLNLQGPAVAVDTACSSSLVAIHLACQSLWSNETEMALAGGVCIQTTPKFYENAGRAGMLSPTGHCYTFDDRADGFVPGEGVGVVVLKRLRDAIADGDHIYGIIRGSGINQDGTTNGITAPSAISQERLERHVYDTFGIHPEQIQMVEAHGTGTKLGDPIEYGALTRAFRHYTDKKGYCAIGSIKTNIGHAAAAAGVAGLIKILLAMKHRQIPP